MVKNIRFLIILLAILALLVPYLSSYLFNFGETVSLSKDFNDYVRGSIASNVPVKIKYEILYPQNIQKFNVHILGVLISRYEGGDFTIGSEVIIDKTVSDSGELTFNLPGVYLGKTTDESGRMKPLFKDPTVSFIAYANWNGNTYFSTDYIRFDPATYGIKMYKSEVKFDLREPISEKTLCVSPPRQYVQELKRFVKISEYSIEDHNIRARMVIPISSRVDLEEKVKYYIFDEYRGCWTQTKWFSYSAGVINDFGYKMREYSGPLTLEAFIKVKFRYEVKNLLPTLVIESLVPIDTTQDPLDTKLNVKPLSPPPTNIDSWRIVYQGQEIVIPMSTPKNWAFYVEITLPLRYTSITIGVKNVDTGNPIHLLISVAITGGTQKVLVQSYDNSEYQKTYSIWTPKVASCNPSGPNPNC